MCPTCVSDYTREHTEAQARAFAESEARHKAQISRESIDDPHLKLVTLITQLGRRQYWGSGGVRIALDESPLRPALQTLYPDWAPRSEFDTPWNSADLARWFAATATAASIAPTGTVQYVTYTKQGFRKKSVQHSETLAGWSFPMGSNVREKVPETYPAMDAFVTVDGRYTPSPENNEYGHWQYAGLTAVALEAMRRYLQDTGK